MNFEEGFIATIIKEKWLKFQLDKLKEASTEKQNPILICVLDREESIFALSKKSGYEILSSIEGEVQKKEERAVSKGSFYKKIIELLEEYSKRYKTENIIVASPAFWKEELINQVEDDLKKKITLATCSSVGNNAIGEVLRRPETKEVLKKDRISKETNLVEDLFKEISKEDLAAYGLKEVSNAANQGAVKVLLVTDSFITKKREEENYAELDNIMRMVDSTKGEVHIISSEFEGGKKLDGLGGIGVILRYKINY